MSCHLPPAGSRSRSQDGRQDTSQGGESAQARAGGGRARGQTLHAERGNGGQEPASGRHPPRAGRERGAEDAHGPGGEGARPRSLGDSALPGVRLRKLSFVGSRHSRTREGWLLGPRSRHARPGSDQPGSRLGPALAQTGCVAWAATCRAEPQFPHLENGTRILPSPAHVRVK